jgi:protein-S-isoprenylcysteine O-methyltransferase Ste14
MESFWSLVEPLVQVAPKVVLIAGAVVFPVLFFITAPYGRHGRAGWGPSLSPRLGWVIMESPSVFLFTAVLLANPHFGAPMVSVLAALWLLHYLQRTFVFTSLMPKQGKPMPVVTVGMAIVFNVLNASGNAGSLAPREVDLPFIVGTAVFLGAMALNVHSDHVLRTLRAPGETGYKIPQAGAFRLVSAPNYLGEILEWVGFAIAAQTLAGWAFAAFTFANLAPRAVSNHRWYRAQFADYPKARRALIPFIW